MRDARSEFDAAPAAIVTPYAIAVVFLDGAEQEGVEAHQACGPSA